MQALTHEERFHMWFGRPFHVLEKGKQEDDKDWNGAFLALSLGLFLCERFYRVATSTHDDPPDPKPGDWDSRFKEAAAKDLNIHKDFFEAFWTVFRHGVQHQGMPKKTFRGYKGVKIWQRWDISADYPDLPQVAWDNGDMVICLNPWGFTKQMLKKFSDSPDELQKGFTHAFGEIRSGSAYACSPLPHT
jgi:hypothetical protein